MAYHAAMPRRTGTGGSSETSTMVRRKRGEIGLGEVEMEPGVVLRRRSCEGGAMGRSEQEGAERQEGEKSTEAGLSDRGELCSQLLS